jgi:hypothetical protein
MAWMCVQTIWNAAKYIIVVVILTAIIILVSPRYQRIYHKLLFRLPVNGGHNKSSVRTDVRTSDNEKNNRLYSEHDTHNEMTEAPDYQDDQLDFKGKT